MNYKKIGLVADKAAEAQNALYSLRDKYHFTVISDSFDVNNADFDAVIALGGDGFMLHSLHRFMSCEIPIYGMNCGTVGFLMNEYSDENIPERLQDSVSTYINPLKMIATDSDGHKHYNLAINEVSLLRNTGQAAKIKVSIDNVVHIDEIVCDGIIVATPAGSSAYNFSAGGPILPIKSNLLALTPISPFRPRRWKGALLPCKSCIKFEILHSKKRPVNAVADFKSVNDIICVEIQESREHSITLLFDKGHSLEERILKEQFSI